MTLYLCGNAALDVMRYLRATNSGEIPGEVKRPRRLKNAVHTNRELNELGHSAELLLEHVQGRVEALVPSTDQITRTSRLCTRLWSQDLPSGAFTDLGNGIYLSTPAFLFVQLAPKLDDLELALLGLELCGFYSKWRLPVSGIGTAITADHGDTTYDLLPATTTERLAAFVGRMSYERGAVNSRKALRWVLNNAASPAESATYLLLCFPRHLGGYGLPKPAFNVAVRVSTSFTHEQRFPDLYWAARSLDVEYQSDYAHSGDWARYRDSRREVELEAESVTVLPLTRAQLVNADEFASFATSVRRNLGVRTRPLPDDWWSRHLELRRRLGL